MKITCEGFCWTIFYGFKKGLMQQECSIELLVMKHHQKRLFTIGLQNFVVIVHPSMMNTMKNDQNCQRFKQHWCYAQDDWKRSTCHLLWDRSFSGNTTNCNIFNLHKHLAIKKICFKWNPHNLTEAEKEALANWCKVMLKNSNSELQNPYTTLLQVTKLGWIHISWKLNNNPLFGCF